MPWMDLGETDLCALHLMAAHDLLLFAASYDAATFRDKCDRQNNSKSVSASRRCPATPGTPHSSAAVISDWRLAHANRARNVMRAGLCSRLRCKRSAA